MPEQPCRCEICDVDHVQRKEVGNSLGQWFITVTIFLKCRQCGKVYSNRISEREISP